ncbi:MAG: hypothetical protein AMJ94_01715 [Deltaproteobacteria bacterium SM23_61]|nr:MAG: hypothetical protein AMJ94_01715 [Deltaproteobacteria bacterium SM23_61]
MKHFIHISSSLRPPGSLRFSFFCFGELKSFFLWILHGKRPEDKQRGSRERKGLFLKTPLRSCPPGRVGNGTSFILASRGLSL